jgi:hypothetical protein
MLYIYIYIYIYIHTIYHADDDDDTAAAPSKPTIGASPANKSSFTRDTIGIPSKKNIAPTQTQAAIPNKTTNNEATPNVPKPVVSFKSEDKSSKTGQTDARTGHTSKQTSETDRSTRKTGAESDRVMSQDQNKDLHREVDAVADRAAAVMSWNDEVCVCLCAYVCVCVCVCWKACVPHYEGEQLERP